MKTKNLLHNKIIIGSFLVAILCSAGVCFISNSASALTYQSSTNVGFTFNPAISISLSDDLLISSLSPGSTSDSNIINVAINTNASQGYTLTATAGTSSTTTNLVNTGNNNNIFTSLATNATITDWANANDNTWGYSYSEDNGTTWISGKDGSNQNILGYSGLPLDNDDSGATGKTLISTTLPSDNKTLKFKIGAKASSSQAAGDYTNIINFYAVANPEPPTIASLTYMQDVTVEHITNTPTDITYTLKDKRDETEYTVAKLRDDNLWMTQNLELGQSDQIISLTNAMSNVSTDGYTLTPLNSTYKNDISKIGNYYTWIQATAGSGVNNDGANAQYDICPKGWRLPISTQQISSDNEFYNMITNYITTGTFDGTTWTGTTITEYTNAPISLLLSGYATIEGASGPRIGERGFWWSSTSNGRGDSNAYGYGIRSDGTVLPLYSDKDDDDGRSIRCIMTTDDY